MKKILSILTVLALIFLLPLSSMVYADEADESLILEEETSVLYDSEQPTLLVEDGEKPLLIDENRAHPPLLVDEAGYLSSSEFDSLSKKLNEISERQKMDVAVVTINSLDGQSPMVYADDYYDYNGYGQGDSKDGILLLISRIDREWRITTTGNGIDAFTDAGQEYLSEKFKTYLSDGDMYEAFDTFADMSDDYITQYKNGTPYDTNNMPKEPFKLFRNSIIGLIAGFLSSLVTTRSWKSKLGTVRKQTDAATYMANDTLNIVKTDAARDIFLYNNISRVPISTDSSGRGGGGGSSVHTSSSGTSHGGSGGHF